MQWTDRHLLENAGMKRNSATPSALAFATAALCLITNSAAAQNLAITVEEITDLNDGISRDRGDSNIQLTLDTNPIGRAECLFAEGGGAPTGVTLTLSITRSGDVSTSDGYDFWRGDEPCNDANDRSDLTNSSCIPLLTGDDATTPITSDNPQSVTFRLDELLDNGLSSDRPDGATIGEDTMEELCVSGENEIVLTILATSSSASTADVGENYGTYTIGLDNNLPTISGLSGGSGESQISASWNSTDDDNLRDYRGFLQFAGNSVESCESTDIAAAATAGVPLDETLGFSDTSSAVNTATRLTLNTTTEIEDDEVFYYSMTVLAVDDGFNRSEVEALCVQQISTTGFCEAYDPERGCPSGCATSSTPACQRGQCGSDVLWVACALLLLGFTRRKTHRNKR